MTYSYSFDKEIFIGPFDSVEEAIAQAREDCCGERSEVYIGEDGEFNPSVDGEWCMDMLRDQAREECGEAADSYLEFVTKESEKELTKMLTYTFNVWAKNNGHEPCFYPVKNVKTYSLDTGAQDAASDALDGWRRSV